MEENERESSRFQPQDVSRPVALRRESDMMREQRAAYRRWWFKRHRTHIFVAVGVLLVALIALGIRMYQDSANPMSRLITAAVRDFDGSFDFTVTLSENGESVMRYDGAIELNRQKHSVRASYDAQYAGYSYTGVTCPYGQGFRRGVLYNDSWTVRDCTERVQNFFDFDNDYCRGSFDGGALLRFAELTSDYSAAELNRFEKVFRSRMSSDSELAHITKTEVDGGTQFDYEIEPSVLFDLIESNGASMFYRSTDYDRFRERYALNKDTVASAKCRMRYVISPQGYLTEFDITLSVGGVDYMLDCDMSGFGTAEVEIPEAFLESARQNEPTTAE